MTWGPEQGRELAALREDAGLRQIDLARELGFSDSALRRYEQGLPPKESRQRALHRWMDGQRQQAATTAQEAPPPTSDLLDVLRDIAASLRKMSGRE